MPFESPNHTQIPNDLFDCMLPDMGYAELKVTLVALRKTLGWQKHSDKISLSQMIDLTGLSRQGVLDGAEAAEERGTITREDGYITTWIVNLVDHPKTGVVKPVDQDGLPARPKVVKPVDLQKKETKNKEKRSAKEPRALPDSLFPVASAIAKVCRMDLQANSARIFREAKLLRKATPSPTPELIEQHYNGNSAAFWRASDWRGQKGNSPTPAAIRETWGQWASQPSASAPVKMFDPAAHPSIEVAPDEHARALALLNKRIKK